MPDVWTFNRPMLRDALELAGARCGLESRVLKPRDPEWTCHINGHPYSYDIYIHEVSQLWRSQTALSLLVLMLLGALALGFIWGRVFAPRGRHYSVGPG